MWLTDHNIPYYFGHKSYKPQCLKDWAGISTFMGKINTELQVNCDSCLVVRYATEDQALSLHKDDEQIIDNDHPIVTASLGSTRVLQFWDSKTECTGTLIKEINPSEGDLIVMNTGCQEKLWHKILQSTWLSRKIQPANLEFGSN